MGSWGSGTFENDKAQDWLWDLDEAEDPAGFLRAAIEAVQLGAKPSYDASIGVLSLAELIATQRGRRPGYLPDIALGLLGEERPVADAIAAIDVDSVRNALRQVEADSEMRDTAAESGMLDEWLGRIDDVRARLRPQD